MGRRFPRITKLLSSRISRYLFACVLLLGNDMCATLAAPFLSNLLQLSNALQSLAFER